MMKEFIKWISNGTAENDKIRLCPIINDPDPNCYSTNMNNRNILLALRFCINNFNQCTIYKRVRENRRLNP